MCNPKFLPPKWCDVTQTLAVPSFSLSLFFDIFQSIFCPFYHRSAYLEYCLPARLLVYFRDGLSVSHYGISPAPGGCVHIIVRCRPTQFRACWECVVQPQSCSKAKRRVCWWWRTVQCPVASAKCQHPFQNLWQVNSINYPQYPSASRVFLTNVPASPCWSNRSVTMSCTFTSPG